MFKHNKIICTCFSLVFLFILLSNAYAQTDTGTTWVYGTVATQPTELNYGLVFDAFNFSMTASNGIITLPLPNNIVVVAVKGVLQTSELSVGTTLNLTGIYVTDQPNPQSPPAGVFLVSSVTRNVTTVEDWRTALTALVNDIAQIGKLLVTLVVGLVQSFTGYTLPSYTVGLVMVFIAIGFVIRFFDKLPKYIVLLTAIICIAVLLYVLSPYFG
jgi:hypothetical protein